MLQIEILAPVGDWEMFNAAVNAGADSIYLGVKGINMRASARNFELKELKKVVEKAHENNVKVYLTVNTIVFEDEIKKIEGVLDKAKEFNVDAVIAWDLGVLKLARERDIEVHLSTQGSCSNSVALNEYRELGIKRVILARECSLKEIKRISKKTNVEIEVFCHGAMCVAESGRCFISEYQHNKSANRGECYQNCRRKYLIKDAETGDELNIEGKHVLSAKDLCTIPILDEILKSGVKALKIEGRGRSAEYVDKVVRVYKRGVDLALKGKLDAKNKKELVEELKEVYHRGDSKGFYLGRPIEDFWDKYGGESKFKKEYLGKVLNYFSKKKVLHSKVESGFLEKDDRIMVIGEKTGVVYQEINSLRNDDGKEVEGIKKGEVFTCHVEDVVRKNDKIYKMTKKNGKGFK